MKRYLDAAVSTLKALSRGNAASNVPFEAFTALDYSLCGYLCAYKCIEGEASHAMSGIRPELPSTAEIATVFG